MPITQEVDSIIQINLTNLVSIQVGHMPATMYPSDTMKYIHPHRKLQSTNLYPLTSQTAQ